MNRTLVAVSMFGLTNSKELLQRCVQAGVNITPEFFTNNQWRKLNDCADAIEAAYPVWVSGENVVPRENGWYFTDLTASQIKLQSTIQPQSFVTIPLGSPRPFGHADALVNDLCASGLYRAWG